MLESSKKIWFYLISLLFIAANGLFLYHERYEMLGVPVLIYLIYLAFFRLDQLYYIVIFLVPLSVNLDSVGVDLGIGIALPTEPLIVGMMMVFILKLFYEGKFDSKIIRHPVTWLILLQLIWVFITVLTSSDIVVSFKFLLSRLWFVSVFYFIASQVLINERNQRKFVWLYLLGFLPVLVYTFIEHSQRGFDQESANWVMNPFFNDHTSYGACLAMILPFLLWQSFSPRVSGAKRILVLVGLLIFITATILSYTRAAWVSLVGAFGVFVIMRFKIKAWIVWTLGLGCGLLLFLSKDNILNSMERNKQDSSSNFSEHVESSFNVSSDASNLERINRWKSAWAMFLERPIVGFGPGTYAFEYAPYQQSRDKTIISTNSGDGGNAHSEYLGPLSEQGLFGSIFKLGIVIAVTLAARRVYLSKLSKESRMIGLSVYLGLVTYYLHGILNNFLDTDKASALFWGFSALIVVLDIQAKALDKSAMEEKKVLD